MDSLIREKNGKDEIWYSEEYFKTQLQESFRAGIHKGIKVQFHAVEPMNGEAVKNLVSEFKRILDEEYQKAYSNNEIIRTT